MASYKINTLFTVTYDNLKNSINGIKSQFKSVEQSADSVKKKVNNTFESTNRDIQKNSNYIKTSSNLIDSGLKASTIAIAAITVPTILAGKSALTMAGQYEAATQTLEYTLGDAKNIVDDFVENNAQKIGMAEQDAYKFANIYSNLLTTMTSDQATNAEYTNKLMQASAVIMSKTGRTFTDVADRIRSGLLGNTEAIEDLGVNVNVALLETTEAFSKIADGRSWEQLTFQEQQQVRLLGILEQTSKKYREEVGNNLSLKLAQTSASFKNIKTEASQFLAVGLEPILGMINNVLSGIMVFVQYLNSLDDSTKKAITTFIVIVAIIPVVALVFFTLLKAINTYIIFTKLASSTTQLLTKSVVGLLGGVLLLIAGIAMLAYAFGAFDNSAKSINKTSKNTSTATKALDGLSTSQNNNAKSAEKASKANKELADNLQGFDEINKLNIDNNVGSGSDLDSSIGPNIDLSGIDTDAFDNIGNQFENLTDKVNNFKNVMEKLKPIIGVIGALLTGLGLASLIKSFKNLIKPISENLSNLTNFSGGLKNLIKIAGGVTLAIKGISDIQTAWGEEIYDTTKVIRNLTQSQLDAGKGALELAAGGALIGSTFGPVGALIGLIIGALASLIQTIINFNNVAKETSVQGLFGDLEVTEEQLNSLGQTVIESVGLQTTAFETLSNNIKSLSTEASNSVGDLSTLIYSYKTLGSTLSGITNNDLLGSVEKATSDVTKMITETSNGVIKILTNQWSKSTTLTESEQKDIVSIIQNSSKNKSDKVNEIEKNITSILENATNERRNLTKQEIQDIQNYYNELAELTRSELDNTNAELTSLIKMLSENNSNLSQESWQKINETIMQKGDEATKLIEEDYQNQLRIASYAAQQAYDLKLKETEDKLLAQRAYDETYSKLLTDAITNETTQKQKLNEKMKELDEKFNSGVYTRRAELNANIINAESSKDRTLAEAQANAFKNSVLKYTEYMNSYVTTSGNKGKEAASVLSKNFENNIKWTYPDLPDFSTSAAQKGKTAGEALGNGVYRGMSNILNNKVFSFEAALDFNKFNNAQKATGSLSLRGLNIRGYEKGGVFTNSSLINVAEYANAGMNPEIVTPRNMMYDTIIQANKDSQQENNYQKNNSSDTINKKIEVELNLKSGGVKLGKQIVDLVLDANDFYDLGLI